ncbi:MAG: SIR2 family protein [Melioribacteraceae bacterium]|nr:SIR2 family protein [Melioribacteraceae bacterium]MCF8263071.1 SIR2 family protein [Melioribacteraceae bacterium]MCF8414327.1 SIR2 family protein [Melioribacteraceae bacterium]MCF8431219.1 SIR2 family protein [Melioribacteraceae bacterium]
MQTNQFTFIQQPAERDTVFIFGAGTSQPDGVPLQNELLPLIVNPQNKYIYNSSIGKKVIKFISENFHFNVEKKQYPKLEGVFGFLDYFIQQNESLNAEYTHSSLIEIREYLIKLIHYVVDEKTNEDSIFYHRFWEVIRLFNNNITIITLNYDTLLEQAFDIMFKKVGYIDYCIHLMNYEKRDDLKQFRYWVNPKEPVPVFENNANPTAFKIIKLHGSLNWKYCNCCNQTLLTPWDRKIDLNLDKFIGYTYPDMKEYEYVCPLDKTEFSTLIMPPSYVKSLNQQVISQLLSEASRELRATKKLVFCGYSMSDADIHIKALLKKNLSPDVEIIVINPFNSNGLRLKYKALSKSVKFINRSFEDLAFDENMMSEILN